MVSASPNSSSTPGRVASVQCHEMSWSTSSALLMSRAEVMQAFGGLSRRRPGAVRGEKSKPAIDRQR